MLRLMLAILTVGVVASLQAITIQWSLSNSDKVNANDQWDDWTSNKYITKDTLYFVYSQDELTSAEAVYNAASGYKVTTDADGVGTVTALGDTPASDISASVGVFGYSPVDAWLSLDGNGFLDSEGNARGYYYLVLFNPDSSQEDPEYVVSNAMQYTGNTKETEGIYNTTVNPGELPEVGEFIDVGWMGGTWTDVTVPEPTALALLALGVAGLALRRKI